MPLSPSDIAALAWFVSLLIVFKLITNYGPLARRSLTASIQFQRRRWLHNMTMREQRHIDAILLSSLSQSNAFFASTSVLGIAGLAAMLGSGDRTRLLVERLPWVEPSSPELWEIKILFLMSIVIYAFFKFAWAFRLSHYTAILFGAMPPFDAADEEARNAYATHAARMLELVGEHANSGLRSFYYAFAAIAWLFHPILFAAAFTIVILVLLRREFISRASSIMYDVRPRS